MFSFDLNAVSSRSKKGETIAQYLLRRKSAEQYLSIMGNIVPSDPNFQKNFSKFYGLNVSMGMNKANFYNIFAMYTGKANPLYADILNDLANPMTGTGRVEKSFASKMLHSLKDNQPIIDSVVIKKLQADPNTKIYLGVDSEPPNCSKIGNFLANRALFCVFFVSFDLFFMFRAVIFISFSNFYAKNYAKTMLF